MPASICVTCGVQYASSTAPPQRCRVCDDERQFVGWNGQLWTTLDELRSRHENIVDQPEPDLFTIETRPPFAIGQQAHLVRTSTANVLWDCTFLAQYTVETLSALGGIDAIAVSHPHFFSMMVEWSDAFGDVPIYVHSADQRWVTRPDDRITFWEGDRQAIGEGLTLVRCGGHFPGSSVLHWAAGTGGRGALLVGDTIQVVQDRRWVSFMRSYPNLVPLNRGAIQAIVDAVDSLRFDRIYGGWPGRVVAGDARQVVLRSAERYLAAIAD